VKAEDVERVAGFLGVPPEAVVALESQAQAKDAFHLQVGSLAEMIEFSTDRGYAPEEPDIGEEITSDARAWAHSSQALFWAEQPLGANLIKAALTLTVDEASARLLLLLGREATQQELANWTFACRDALLASIPDLPRHTCSCGANVPTRAGGICPGCNKHVCARCRVSLAIGRTLLFCCADCAQTIPPAHLAEAE
jgi:hypothetical protein